MYVCYSQHPGFSCADISDKIIGDMIEEGNQRRIELFKKLSIAQLKLTPTVIQALHTRTRKTPIKAAIQTSNNNAPKKRVKLTAVLRMRSRRRRMTMMITMKRMNSI
jgi:hypothetical protein